MENNDVDVNVLCNGVKVGSYQLALHDDYVFIRHIAVLEQFRRYGYASMMVDSIFLNYNLPIVTCINHNQEAIGFWNHYMGDKRVEHIRGTIYKIYC
jgi:ribosomal protein S18 acetylase RimI-like enzyme